MQRTITIFGALGLCATLAACAHSSTIQLNANTIAVTVSAAPACGITGAQRVAYEDAAIQTLRRGFNRFIIVESGEQDSLAGVINGPVSASTYGSTTTVSGGFSTLIRHHHQQMIVKMFHAGDPMAGRAVSAKSVLGPKWQEKVENGPPSTC